ncbi:hypothetical protein ACFOY4_43610 [Actinomadura syzygii]|uniref:Uncharacterized protein n=1 Tax=Actinomadura syzygii TaxID=1427538 RepID=A0A5D0UII0_9ACTN|nr:hypothetical protein [Actinomadura syzygii]TYC18208.1 hypothetical protein FXF65_00035 [Actinomadura syzygii]
MSAPRDTRDTAEPAGTPTVPAAPAESAAPASLRPPAFGLEAPWWAAESAADTVPLTGAPAVPPAPRPAPDDATTEDAPADDAPSNDATGTDATGTDAGRDVVQAAAEAPSAPGTGGPPPGTLVAGRGVPSVDSRRAVPALPLVKPPPAFGETDPDGFPPVRPRDDSTDDVLADEPAPAAPESSDTRVAQAEPSPVEAPGVEETAVDDTAVTESADTSAFEKARRAEDESSASLAPVLVPDAILPPGVVPPTGSGPFPTGTGEPAAVTAEQHTVITPVYHAEGGVPIDTPPPPGAPPRRAPRGGDGGNKSRIVLIGGGAALILAAALGLFAIGADSGGGKNGKTSGSPATQAAPAVTPSTATRAPVDIGDEKTDPQDLTFRDVFPTQVIQLGGRTYSRERWSLNRDVSYAARGSMLQALLQEKCRKIVRATYIDKGRALAVTSGIAVLPTKDAALRISKAGSPAKYEWFRGMGGKHAPDLDRAGGYAAATVRGRYVAYAYVQWANGKQAKPGDPVIKEAAQQFLDYDLRPILARAGG